MIAETAIEISQAPVGCDPSRSFDFRANNTVPKYPRTAAHLGSRDLIASQVPWLKRRARRLLARRHLCLSWDDDVVQETLLRMLRSNPSFDHERQFRAWSLKALRSVVASMTERKRPVVNSAVIESASEIAAVRRNDHLDAQCDALLACAARLSRADQIVLHLRYWLDLQYRHIAVLVGVTERAAATRCCRARAKLRAMMQETETC